MYIHVGVELLPSLTFNIFVILFKSVAHMRGDPTCAGASFVPESGGLHIADLLSLTAEGSLSTELNLPGTI